MATTVKYFYGSTLLGEGTTAPDYSLTTSAIPEGAQVIKRELWVDGELKDTDTVNVTVQASGGGGGGYTPPANYEQEYKDWLIYLNANDFDLPDSTQQDLDNEKVANLKTEGIWTELDFLYMNEAVYSPSSYATNAYRVNFKDPGTFTRTADAGKEPDWVSGKGFKVIGGSGDFQRTGFNPYQHAVKSVGNNASLIFKLFDTPTTFSSTVRIYGGTPATGSNGIVIAQSGQNTLLGRLYQNSGLEFSGISINNHLHLSVDGLNVKIGVNGVDSGTTLTKDQTGAQTPSVEMIEFGYNSASPSLTTEDLGISYLMQGSNLKAKEAVIYSIMNGTY